ncbi:response regulator [Flavihumibacter sp. CACIAM 22H1]|uniref:response regulator n=1 Tax=Flavihumibacter sp. CACIAM 22H1 TaxID=1812911 RepID=UPI0007A7E178|nr:response regulator [Flavihumibacter sp. CACIAM 22H1]KYP15945.1 MAG: two-component system response regulator [Flavihumibacter sp. CACIAM 22H1]
MKNMHILLVEDNEGDIVLTREALQEVENIRKISIAKDGKEALQFLFKTGRFTDAESPDLVLLDINLPKIDGKEVLQKIKQHETLCMLPVIILTTSSSDKDIFDSYTNHANCFITKPVDYFSFMKVIKTMEAFWMKTAQLPNS